MQVRLRRHKRITYERIKSCRKTARDNSLEYIALLLSIYFITSSICATTTRTTDTAFRSDKKATKTESRRNYPAGMDSCVFLVGIALRAACMMLLAVYRLRILLTTTGSIRAHSLTYLFLIVFCTNARGMAFSSGRRNVCASPKRAHASRCSHYLVCFVTILIASHRR